METFLNSARVALAWLVLAGATWLIYRAVRLMNHRLRDAHSSRVRSSSGVTGVLSLFWRHSTRLILGLVRLSALFLFLLLLSIILSYSFSLFESTQDLSVSLWATLHHAAVTVLQGILGYLPNLALLLVIVFICYYLNKLLHIFFSGLERGDIHISGFYADWAEPTYELSRFLLIVFGIVVAFPYLPGSQSGALQGVSIFFGVLISFGSTSAVSNLVAGVFLTYMRPFRLGDRIRIGDTFGDVIERNLLITRIRTIKNEEVTLPNGTVLGAPIANYSAEARTHGLILHTAITIGYDAPWRTVHQLLIDAALATNGVLSDPPPFVFQTALNDFNVSYEINAYTERPTETHIIYAELNQNIQEKFNAGGVEIMSPTYLSLRDGNTVTIPEDQRPSGYRTPGFRVDRTS